MRRFLYTVAAVFVIGLMATGLTGCRSNTVEGGIDAFVDGLTRLRYDWWLATDSDIRIDLRAFGVSDITRAASIEIELGRDWWEVYIFEFEPRSASLTSIRRDGFLTLDGWRMEAVVNNNLVLFYDSENAPRGEVITMFEGISTTSSRNAITDGIGKFIDGIEGLGLIDWSLYMDSQENMYLIRDDGLAGLLRSADIYFRDTFDWLEVILLVFEPGADILSRLERDGFVDIDGNRYSVIVNRNMVMAYDHHSRPSRDVFTMFEAIR